MRPDTMYVEAIDLAERLTFAGLHASPVLAEILDLPIPSGTSPRSWRFYRLEEAVSAAQLWGLDCDPRIASAVATWNEAIMLRWALVGLIQYRRSDADKQGEAMLSAYHATILYDGSTRFATYARHWMNRSDRIYDAETHGPVRVPRKAYTAGVRVHRASFTPSAIRQFRTPPIDHESTLLDILDGVEP